MAKTKKRSGFTIVELVIVIAVIAILAAVLIPTFASLTRKANLSADKQAVREMNMALAADEARNGKCENVEQAMQVLANAGYNTRNWQCLTDGYEVYWYKTDNRCVLYNSATDAVEYPEEYDFDNILNDPDNFFKYNQFVESALKEDFSLSSGSATAEGSISSGGGVLGTILSSESGSVPDGILASLGAEGSGDLKVYAYKQINGSHTVVDVIAAGTDETPELSSSGEIEPNLYYISVKDGADTDAAAAEACDYVYKLFTQINAGLLSGDASIVFEPGTTLKLADDKVWQPVKLFTGYFGTTDADNPIVIDGLKLDERLAFGETYTFLGPSAPYYMSGFMGVVYGETTIENVVFRNIHIQEPAAGTALANHANNNTVGIIGGIVTPVGSNTPANVTLRNIVVEESCSVTGFSRAGGLVGFIGGYMNNTKPETYTNLSGSVNIEGCKIYADVTSSNNLTSHGTAGGIVGFILRDYDMTVTITETIYEGSVTGWWAGGVVGDIMQHNDAESVRLVLNNVDVSGAELTDYTTDSSCSSAAITRVNGSVVTIITNGFTAPSGVDLITVNSGNRVTYGTDGDTDEYTASIPVSELKD